MKVSTAILLGAALIAGAVYLALDGSPPAPQPRPIIDPFKQPQHYAPAQQPAANPAQVRDAFGNPITGGSQPQQPLPAIDASGARYLEQAREQDHRDAVEAALRGD